MEVKYFWKYTNITLVYISFFVRQNINIIMIVKNTTQKKIQLSQLPKDEIQTILKAILAGHSRTITNLNLLFNSL